MSDAAPAAHGEPARADGPHRRELTIRVTGLRDGPAARFSVEDSGPGFRDGQIAHLFDPYWSGAEHARQGAGLGLYIVRGIVESHGGKVWAESVPGAGARFVFTLPTTD